MCRLNLNRQSIFFVVYNLVSDDHNCDENFSSMRVFVFSRLMIEMEKFVFKWFLHFRMHSFTSAKCERINFNQFGRVHLNDMRKLRANICKIFELHALRVFCDFVRFFGDVRVNRVSSGMKFQRLTNPFVIPNFSFYNSLSDLFIRISVAETKRIELKLYAISPAYRHRAVFAVSLLMTKK